MEIESTSLDFLVFDFLRILHLFREEGFGNQVLKELSLERPGAPLLGILSSRLELA